MARSKPGSGLPFEKPIAEALERLAKLRAKHEEGKHDLSEQIATAELDAQTVTREIFDNLTAIERVKLARGFGDLAFQLQPGEFGVVSYDPVRSPFGFHVITRLR